MPAIVAVLLGSLLAVVALVPWVALQYRRRGAVGFGPTVIAIGTLIYSLALVTYTMLPLPRNVSALCAEGGAGRQWRPGQFLRDIADQGGWHLHNPAVMQFLLNIVLFVPLGMVVRYVFLRRWPAFLTIPAAITAGFSVSLLIETTQLTGNWFLYPCSYRVFDVDDLIANTGGAFLGALVAPVLTLIPGQKQRLRADAPRRVTIWRRSLGILCDLLTMGAIAVVSTTAVNVVAYVREIPIESARLDAAHVAAGFVAPAALLLMVLLTGRTFGEAAVRLRPVRSPNALQRLLRWALGAGGWLTLLQIDRNWAAISAGLMGLATFLWVWGTRRHRGFAAWVAQIHIDDERRTRSADMRDARAGDTAELPRL